MRRGPVSRRVVLRSSVAAVALPLLDDVVRPRRAQAQSQPKGPKRFIMLYSPNGTIPEAWFPKGTQTDFTLGPIMEPLTPHKKDLILFRNVDNFAATKQPFGDPHGCGTGCLFTAVECLPGELFKAGMGGPGSGWPGGASVDQIIAGRVGTATKFASIELAVKAMAGSIFSRLSYKKAEVPVSPESDPGKAFDRIFATVGGDAVALERLRRRRKSVLDEVRGQFETISTSFSTNDRKKVDAHLTALRELEKKLDTTSLAGAGGACKKLPRPALGESAEVKANQSGMQTINASNDVDVPERNKLMRELMTMALACDLTRVISNMMAPSRSDIVMGWLGHKDAHHAMSHMARPGIDPKLVECHRWYAEQVAALIAALKAVPESGGTLWDRCVLVWGNELGLGQNHQRTQIPILMAGSAGGHFRTGQFINFMTPQPQNRILLSLCHAMGLTDVTTIGNPKYCVDGPVPGIVA